MIPGDILPAPLNQLLDGARSGQIQPVGIHPGVQQVHMAVGEAGQHAAPLQINVPGILCPQRKCLPIGAHQSDAPILNRHRRPIPSCHGVHNAIIENRIHVLCLLQCILAPL